MTSGGDNGGDTKEGKGTAELLATVGKNVGGEIGPAAKCVALPKTGEWGVSPIVFRHCGMRSGGRTYQFAAESGMEGGMLHVECVWYPFLGQNHPF